MNRYILGAMLAGAAALMMYGIGSSDNVANWIDNAGQNSSGGANQVANSNNPDAVAGAEPVERAGQLAQRQTPEESPAAASNYSPPEQSADTPSPAPEQPQAETSATQPPAETTETPATPAPAEPAVDSSIPALW